MRAISTLILAVSLVFAVAPLSHAETKANGFVIMFTDYDTASIYVGELKGAIYAMHPNVRIDTLTNSVPNYDIVAGAYMLVEGCLTFPAGTTFVCVVDPGVGTKRRPIALETKNGLRFVAPDNGLLTLVAQRYGVAEVRECTNKELWRASELSYTFHGRDVFGPVSGALADGVPMEKVGPVVTDMVMLELGTSVIEGDSVTGEVVRTDHYGNIVTNITVGDMEKLGLKRGDSISVTLGKTSFTAPFVETYANVPQGNRLVAIQSAGYVELAVNMGSLTEESGEGEHAKVVLKKAPAAK